MLTEAQLLAYMPYPAFGHIGNLKQIMHKVIVVSALFYLGILTTHNSEIVLLNLYLADFVSTQGYTD